jgi:hypothetical protein
MIETDAEFPIGITAAIRPSYLFLSHAGSRLYPFNIVPDYSAVSASVDGTSRAELAS